jgi:HEPN domain-containing protein
MKKPLDLAQRFFSLAHRDIRAFEVLLKAKSVDDSVIGFHAQQAIEKMLKAILSLHQAEFRKTHDLGELLDLLNKMGIELPPDYSIIDELNPYAVSLRYDFFAEEAALDRVQAKQIIASTLRWVEAQIGVDDNKGQKKKERT